MPALATRTLEAPPLRLRIAICAFSLLALAGFHLQPSLAAPTPPRPQASYSAPVASSGPTAESGRAALVVAIRAAHEAQVAAWYTFWAAQPAPAPAPAAKKSGGTTAGSAPTGYEGDVWWALSGCESGHQNDATGNGFWGYFQFTLSTWHGIGEAGSPVDYDYEHQRAAAQRLQARSGWGQWPLCARQLGLL